MITGERVVTSEGGFNPTYQRHVATYRLLRARCCPDGRVLDLGCGVGHSFAELAPRETVGVDLTAEALAGQERETHVADMRELPLADSSLRVGALACSRSSTSRIPSASSPRSCACCEPGGTAIFVTPNRLEFARADEIIDPYHYVEFDPDELAALCARHFEHVEIQGLFGSRALARARRRRARAAGPAAAPGPAAARAGSYRAAARQWLYDCMLTRNRARARPARARDHA